MEIEWLAVTIMKIEMFWSLLTLLNLLQIFQKPKIIVNQKKKKYDTKKKLKKQNSKAQIILDFGY